MNFFEIKSLVTGLDLTSYGRVGLDYNKKNDNTTPSFASYLKKVGIIDKNLVTFSHNSLG